MLDPKQAGNSPRAEVLKYIQRQGSASVKDLEAAMGVTTTAVREQLAHLMQEGFLQATRVRGEIGRPYYVYSLTSTAHNLFPKGYSTLAQLLLEESLSMYGREGLRMLLNRVSRRISENLGDRTQGTELSQKLLGLAAGLGETGMEVSMLPVEGSDNEFVLKTHSCPYFDIAQNHREICDMEEEMLAGLLGPGVEVRLGGRIVEGQCACDFHVSRIPVEAIAARKKITSAGRPE